ncbi:conserved phage C-terminal domain-containing protein [Liquorilactobacillus nagelii]|uniref:conserved phage C-terminal domain-containing protein n=1 Tax=Liquorilactobacillus nagelii TaxID=82688 RepID=UPI0039EC1E56
MAQRRMFSNRITNSAKFLKMPLSSQALYFHLGLHADDDGVVEAFTIMRQVGAVEDDLRILAAKGFVVVLNEDLVTYIADWNENNRIRADRKVDSIYKNMLLKILPEAEVINPKPRADTGKQTGRPVDNQWTAQVRLGKDRLGKDSRTYSPEKVEDVQMYDKRTPEIRDKSLEIRDKNKTYSPAKAEQHLPYGEIIDYLNEKAGTSYRATTKKTQTLIKARFNEKFSLDDFKRVIDNKVAEWKNDTAMNKFLRPETLFGTKFESYLNQNVKQNSTPTGKEWF